MSVVALAVLFTACRAGDDDIVASDEPATTTTATTAATTPEPSEATAPPADPAYPLPFGLEQVEGTTPVGRPAVFHAYFYDGTELPAVTMLRAAYWVTDDDPRAAFDAWVAQLDRLAVGEVHVTDATGGPGLWRNATGLAGADFVQIDLWSTTTDPILLVYVHRSDAAPRAPAITANGGTPEPPEPVEATPDRGEGDELFTEQDDVIHIPPGVRMLATIPTQAGTGGSTSVLAAEDGEAAVAAMLDEAVSQSRFRDAVGPMVSERDGTRVVYASFSIPAGGWSFTAVAVEAPDDEHATVYVTSAAD